MNVYATCTRNMYIAHASWMLRFMDLKFLFGATGANMLGCSCYKEKEKGEGMWKKIRMRMRIGLGLSIKYQAFVEDDDDDDDRIERQKYTLMRND